MERDSEISSLLKRLEKLNEILKLNKEQGASQIELESTKSAIVRIKKRLHKLEYDKADSAKTSTESSYQQSQKEGEQNRYNGCHKDNILRNYEIIKGYVQYNGKTHSCDPCAPASNLKEGKIYGVVAEEELDNTVMLHLIDPISWKELPGRYNCIWLDQKMPKHRWSHEIPKVGKTLETVDGIVLSNILLVNHEKEKEYFVLTTASVNFVHIV